MFIYCFDKLYGKNNYRYSKNNEKNNDNNNTVVVFSNYNHHEISVCLFVCFRSRTTTKTRKGKKINNLKLHTRANNLNSNEKKDNNNLTRYGIKLIIIKKLHESNTFFFCCYFIIIIIMITMFTKY